MQSFGRAGAKYDVLTRELGDRSLIPDGARVVIGTQGRMKASVRVRFVIIGATIITNVSLIASLL